MLDGDDNAHLTDFGLAHRHQDDGTHTRDGAVLGTPAYMAPEQAAGKKGDPLPASDQYGLGVLFYELLCGRTPFDGPAVVQIYNALHTLPPPHSLRIDIPLNLERVCLLMLVKRPAERYASCAEVADELRRWQAVPAAVVPAKEMPETIPPPAASATGAVPTVPAPPAAVPVAIAVVQSNPLSLDVGTAPAGETLAAGRDTGADTQREAELAYVRVATARLAVETNAIQYHQDQLEGQRVALIRRRAWAAAAARSRRFWYCVRLAIVLIPVAILALACAGMVPGCVLPSGQ